MTVSFLNEWTPTQKDTLFTSNKEGFLRALRSVGVTPPKHANSEQGWTRFMRYALKRARSDHPHNARWKPLLEAYLAARVSERLESR